KTSTSGFYEMETASGEELTATIAPIAPPVEIDGPWEVSFAAGWGGPASVTFEHLSDWTKSAEEGLKYFSGRATYRKTFHLSREQVGSRDFKYMLDLGDVRDLATVRVNGRELATLWL